MPAAETERARDRHDGQHLRRIDLAHIQHVAQHRPAGRAVQVDGQPLFPREAKLARDDQRCRIDQRHEAQGNRRAHFSKLRRRDQRLRDIGDALALIHRRLADQRIGLFLADAAWPA